MPYYTSSSREDQTTTTTWILILVLLAVLVFLKLLVFTFSWKFDTTNGFNLRYNQDTILFPSRARITQIENRGKQLWKQQQIHTIMI